MKECLISKPIEEIKEILNGYKEKPFHAEQIIKSLYLGLEFSEMSNISIALRQKLEENYVAQPVKIIKQLVSKDGTVKFLFALLDGNVIEGVLMKYKYGYTLCISSQVGCRMGCKFCASGLNGLIRNLTPEEMLGEVITANKYLNGGLKDKRKVINIVMMGSGEPLDNYDNTVKFLRLVTSEVGINVSPRNISLSTSGVVPKIYDLAKLDIDLNLTISLHQAFQEKRQEIMPIAKSYSIKEILDACAYYFNKTKRRYIFEYVLIKGENDRKEDAEMLIKLLKGRPCHVNLIRLNEVKENNLKCGTEKQAYRFMGELIKGGLSATLRRKMGEDINGACGQLRQSYLKEIEND